MIPKNYVTEECKQFQQVVNDAENKIPPNYEGAKSNQNNTISDFENLKFFEKFQIFKELNEKFGSIYNDLFKLNEKFKRTGEDLNKDLQKKINTLEEKYNQIEMENETLKYKLQLNRENNISEPCIDQKKYFKKHPEYIRLRKNYETKYKEAEILKGDLQNLKNKMEEEKTKHKKDFQSMKNSKDEIIKKLNKKNNELEQKLFDYNIEKTTDKHQKEINIKDSQIFHLVEKNKKLNCILSKCREEGNIFYGVLYDNFDSLAENEQKIMNGDSTDLEKQKQLLELHKGYYSKIEPAFRSLADELLD